jgi:hypothetical protein
VAAGGFRAQKSVMCEIIYGAKKAGKEKEKLYIFMLMVDGRIWIFSPHFSAFLLTENSQSQSRKCKFIFVLDVNREASQLGIPEILLEILFVCLRASAPLTGCS